MPYPNEHACRLRNPESLEIVGSDERKHDDKTYRVIFGKPKDRDGSVEQAYRYPVESWSEEAARNHCKDHDGSFEPAAEKTESFLQILTEKANPDAKIFSWSMPARYYMKPGRMIIYGTALVAGQTRKGDVYTREELMRHGCTLIGGPVELFEHSWDVGEPRWLPYPENVVLDAEEVESRLEYIAGIESPKVQELIQEGEINRVSVNAICRHVPPSNPGLCQGMILNGFCLLHKTGIPSSTGTYVKIWNSYHASRLEDGGSSFSSESDGATKMKESKKGKTGQVEPTVQAPIAGVAMPSIEDRVTALETSLAGFKEFVTTGFTDLNAKLDTLIQAQPPPPTAPPVVVATQNVKKTEAEWDTEYVNNLPDSAFAYIESGGEKDEDGKTTPRSLRHFEYKNMEGNLDRKHIVNGLARLGQDLGDWATDAAKTEIKRKLCAALKEWNSEHEDKIESDVCDVHPETKTEQEPGESPPEEPPKKGEPKTDKERFIAHYELTEEQMDQVLEWVGEDVYKLLPERGQKTKTEQMSIEEIKARIAELSKQREDLQQKIWPAPEPSPLSEEERTNIQSQIDVITAEMEALEQAMAEKIAQRESKTEHVVAAVKPIEHEEPLVTLTEQEIYDVIKDKRRFTPALQVNGILDLLEQKRKEAEA